MQLAQTREEQSADDRARELVRDLHSPNPRIFWADLVGTAAVGWIAFIAGVALNSYLSFLAFTIASLALYRGLCFIHELTHIRSKSLPGFDTAWNLLFGVPLLLPSFMYVGVHQDHHKLSTYGTDRDPEYLPFAKSNLMMVFFIAHSVLIPLFLAVRFTLLAPAGFLVPAFRRWLAVHASALSMNLAYEREVTQDLLRSMRIWEVAAFALAVAILTSAFAGVLQWRVLAAWYLVTAAVCVINTLRTLGAHDYESDGNALDRSKQLLDSIDTPGAVWTELWAPVGLRYHALHHYFPGIPYHNLPEAHRRLISALPAGAPYHETLSSGLWHSLGRLYAKGRAARAQHLGAGERAG